MESADVAVAVVVIVEEWLFVCRYRGCVCELVSDSPDFNVRVEVDISAGYSNIFSSLHPSPFPKWDFPAYFLLIIFFFPTFQV